MLPLSYSIPLLVIGGTVAFYWQQVLRMARKQRKRTGNAANLIPPELLGRVLRLVWTPVIIVWVGHPVMSAFWNDPPAMFAPMIHVAGLNILFAGMVVVGMVVTRRCWKQMGKNWRMGINPNEKTSLVFDGPFGYVRHPIYALSACMMAATISALPTPLMLTCGIVHVALLFWESAREEKHLVAMHGMAYEAYRRRVGRLFPCSFRSYGRSDADVRK